MLHDGTARRVAIVGGVRIPFCRANSVYTGSSNQDMMTATLSALVSKHDLKGQTLGDVALGAVIKHSKDWNLARESVIGSGLSLRTPAFDMQRACGTSIEACINIANKIALGQIDSGIAGGTDSISDAPIVYNDGFRKSSARQSSRPHFSEEADPLVWPAPKSFCAATSRCHRTTHQVSRWVRAWKSRPRSSKFPASTRTNWPCPVT